MKVIVLLGFSLVLFACEKDKNELQKVQYKTSEVENSMIMQSTLSVNKVRDLLLKKLKEQKSLKAILTFLDMGDVTFDFSGQESSISLTEIDKIEKIMSWEMLYKALSRGDFIFIEDEHSDFIYEDKETHDTIGISFHKNKNSEWKISNIYFNNKIDYEK